METLEQLSAERPSSVLPSKPLSSHDVFSMFAKKTQNGSSMILSSECYEMWVSSRHRRIKEPEKNFRKTLISHLCGADGRKAFSPEVERTILEEIRKERVWPCFIHSCKKSVRRIGSKRFTRKGFHESILHAKQTQSNSGMNLKIQNESSFDKFYSNLVPSSEMEVDPVYVQPTFVAHKRSLPTVEIIEPLKTPKLDDGAFHSTKQEAIDSCSLDMPLESLFDSFLPQDIIAESMEFPMDDLPDCEALPSSILDTFSDVSQTELEKTNLLKELVSKHIDGSKTMPSHVCGDIKLLRILRSCNGDVNEAEKAFKEFLQWRTRYGLDKIYNKLMEENVSVNDMKERYFTIGRTGGVYPFYCQSQNGDIIDFWVLRPQRQDDLGKLQSNLYSHIYLNEFRSIVLDSLSRVKRRVVCYRVLVDCTVINDGSIHNAKQTQEGVSGSNVVTKGSRVLPWMTALKEWDSHMRNVGDLITRWYGGSCNKVHVFGTGYSFRVLTDFVARKYFGVLLYGTTGIVFTNHPEHNEDVLYGAFGDRQNWPRRYGGSFDPRQSSLANMPLSGFRIRR